MRHRLPLLLWMAGFCCLLAAGILWTSDANQREFETTQNILSMQSQIIARNVDAYQPDYSAYFQRVVNQNPTHLRVILYDLAGREIGRPGPAGPSLPLNTTAARLAGAMSLEPKRGETPLTPFNSIPPEVTRHPRLFNRLYASNILGGAWVEITDSNVGDRWMVATTPVNDYDPRRKLSFISAWLQAAMPMETVAEPLRRRWWRLAAAAGMAGALCFGWWAWTNRQHRTMSALANAAERIPTDRIQGARLEMTDDSPEGARLARACNRLIEKVAEVHQAQQRFVADAAHELRTPLTILRGEIQVALREPANHAFLVQTLRSSLEESVHLSRLVDSLLTLARSDAGQTLAPRQRIDVVELARQTLSKLLPFAAARDVRLELSPADGVQEAHIEGDPLALERILFNLVENAVKHSPPGYAVTIHLRTTPTEVILEVVDRGAGIAPEHLPHLFERFYRIDAARRRAEGGAGLGLALVKTLVQAQGGRVQVRSDIGEGSTFTVTLPALGEASSPPHRSGRKPEPFC